MYILRGDLFWIVILRRILDGLTVVLTFILGLGGLLAGLVGEATFILNDAASKSAMAIWSSTFSLLDAMARNPDQFWI